MISNLRFQWDPASAAWLRGLPDRFAQALQSSQLQADTRLALERYNASVRRAAPRSGTGDPHMGDDWEIVDLEFAGALSGHYFSARVGSTKSQDPAESVSGPSPFNIPAGVHTGFREHVVALYNPRTNTVRRKLAQLVLGAGALGAFADVESLKRALHAANKPLFVTVAAGPRPWLAGPADQFVNELAEDLLGAAYESIGVVAWRV